MDIDRWRRVQRLFHDAAELSPAERRPFLEEACSGDAGLRDEVLGMLHEDAQGSSVLDGDLTEFARHVVGSSSSSVLPTEFGPYTIQSVLGEGGMGVVYLARREDLGNQVAIKVLRDAWLSPSRRKRFTDEQRTLAQLTHPSIARLYDADTLPDGTPWFAMEYVEGLPLTAYCSKYKTTIERCLRLFLQVCEAVQHAHAHAVIHLDLKPSNILVKSDGGVRLLDFGIARQVEGQSGLVDPTRTVFRFMTPAYAAPEQIRNQKVGIQADVYSLGVVLYELLTGRLPFDFSSLTPTEAASIIAEHEPGKPSAAAAPERSGTLSKSSWADLDVLCLTAMHKDSQRRYPSVEALIRDIHHFLRGEPLEARRDSWSYSAGKFVRRNLRAVAATTFAGTAVLSLVAYFTIRLADARDTAQAEAARTQRVQRFMTNLFQGGDQAAGPADTLRVVTLLDRGVQEAKSLAADPAMQAELYQNLGAIYQKLGKFDQADSLLRAALDERKSLFGAESVEVSESLLALAALKVDQAQLDQAEQLARHGLDVSQRSLSPDHPAAARGPLVLGTVLAARGSYEEAIQVLNDAVRVASAASVAESDLAACLSALAAAQYSAGHYEISDSLYRRLLDMHRRIYGNSHPLVAEDLGNLGSIQQDLGYYVEAEKFNRQALQITQSYYGKDHPRAATELTMLGRSLLYQEKYGEAADALQQAMTIQERIFGAVHPSVADTLNELGNIASMRERLDEAESYFRRVVEIYRKVYGDQHYLVAIALSNVASVRLDKKDYRHAEDIYRDVIRRFGQTLAPDNVNTGIARVKLGRTLLRELRYKDAEVESRGGYEILVKQTNPSTSYIRAARKDLVAEYSALKRIEEASRFRAELASVEAKPPAQLPGH